MTEVKMLVICYYLPTERQKLQEWVTRGGAERGAAGGEGKRGKVPSFSSFS